MVQPQSQGLLTTAPVSAVAATALNTANKIPKKKSKKEEGRQASTHLPIKIKTSDYFLEKDGSSKPVQRVAQKNGEHR